MHPMWKKNQLDPSSTRGWTKQCIPMGLCAPRNLSMCVRRRRNLPYMCYRTICSLNLAKCCLGSWSLTLGVLFPYLILAWKSYGKLLGSLNCLFVFVGHTNSSVWESREEVHESFPVWGRLSAIWKYANEIIRCFLHAELGLHLWLTSWRLGCLQLCV